MQIYKTIAFALFLNFILNFNIYSKGTVTNNSHNIIEAQSFSELLELADQNTVIFLDIDNTIIRPKQTLGSDEWFNYYLASLYNKFPDNKQQAQIEALKTVKAVHTASNVEILDPKTVEIIKKLQDKKIRVFALTARSEQFVDSSIKQLNNIGIDFTINNKDMLDIKLDKNSYSYKYKVTVKKAHLFVGFNNKGKVLVDFLNKAKLNNNKILFMDDKLSNVKKVAEELGKNNINYIGLRFAGADNFINNFSAKLADRQLDIFQMCKKLVSNTKVEEFYNHKIKCLDYN